MRADVQVVLSGALTFGVPLVLALRELVVLRRGGGRGWWPDRGPEPEPDPQPMRPTELPACLRPPFGKLVEDPPEWARREMELV